MAGPDPSRRIRVAVILGAHGIRGEVKVRSFMERRESFASYGPLASVSGEQFEVQRFRLQKGDFIVAFKGVAERNRAEALKGVELSIARDKLPEPEGDAVYAHDLVGAAVQLKAGPVLGEIVDVPNYGAGDLLEVKIEGRKDTVLIPFAQSYVVERCRDRIVVDLPEGYLDEDA
jgi:16S rRNA processing protein RimM